MFRGGIVDDAESIIGCVDAEQGGSGRDDEFVILAVVADFKIDDIENGGNRHGRIERKGFLLGGGRRENSEEKRAGNCET